LVDIKAMSEDIRRFQKIDKKSFFLQDLIHEDPLECLIPGGLFSAAIFSTSSIIDLFHLFSRLLAEGFAIRKALFIGVP
jgi:hypothetical protein